jgi:hypothetical protein
VKGFALVLLLGATAYSFAACLVLNLGLFPFSQAAVCAAQILIVPGIIASAREIAAETREKMNRRPSVGIDGSWDNRKNGSVHVLDMTDVESQRVVDFETVQTKTASGRGNYDERSTGIEWKWKQ